MWRAYNAMVGFMEVGFFCLLKSYKLINSRDKKKKKKKKKKRKKKKKKGKKEEKRKKEGSLRKRDQ
jgi:hypothetical protein